MALPATGGTQAQILQPSLNPLNERYWQIVYALVRDRFNANGTVFSLAAPSVGLAPTSDGALLFTPFAADGISIRPDLLFGSNGGNNLGFYNTGLLKPDSVSISPDQSMTETPSAQLQRSTRSVVQKLEDKITFEPQETSPLIKFLQYELPTINGVPAVGTPNLIIPRPNLDIPQERILVLIGIDGDGQLLSRVFPVVVTDKKGKQEMGRKAVDSSMLTYCAEPCPFAQRVEWTCYAGTQWNAAGDFNFLTTAPLVTPVTGLKANVMFPTPIDIASPVYTVALQLVPNGAFTAGTLASPSGTVAGGFTTVQVTGLTALENVNALQITGTGGTVTATSPASAPFVATAT